jgi:hypothetical protein
MGKISGLARKPHPDSSEVPPRPTIIPIYTPTSARRKGTTQNVLAFEVSQPALRPEISPSIAPRDNVPRDFADSPRSSSTPSEERRDASIRFKAVLRLASAAIVPVAPFARFHQLADRHEVEKP